MSNFRSGLENCLAEAENFNVESSSSTTALDKDILLGLPLIWALNETLSRAFGSFVLTGKSRSMAAKSFLGEKGSTLNSRSIFWLSMGSIILPFNSISISPNAFKTKSRATVPLPGFFPMGPAVPFRERGLSSILALNAIPIGFSRLILSRFKFRSDICFLSLVPWSTYVNWPFVMEKFPTSKASMGNAWSVDDFSFFFSFWDVVFSVLPIPCQLAFPFFSFSR